MSHDAKNIFVLGSTGNIGAATVKALSELHGGKLPVTAGARNAEKAKAAFGHLPGVRVVQADFADAAGLVSAFRGVDSLYLVTPGAEDRGPLTVGAIDAAKKAQVQHVTIVSLLTTGTDTIFGKQVTPIESALVNSGLSYTALRLPLFLENNFAHQEAIKGQKTIYCPMDALKFGVGVAVGDAAKAAAVVLSKPREHAGRVYKLFSARFTQQQLADAFGAALGEEVKYVQVPYDAARESFLGMGFPAWQTDGILELYKMIDADSPLTNPGDSENDYANITGEQPTSLQAWVDGVKGAFKAP